MTRTKNKGIIFLIVLSVIIGIVALLSSVGGFLHVAEQSGYRTATGVVTDVDSRNMGNKIRTNMRCSPIVKFGVDGKSYSQGPDQYSVYGKGTKCEYSVGQLIDVRYDPSDPSKATVSNSTFDWMMGVVGAVAALIFGLILPLRMIVGPRTKTE